MENLTPTRRIIEAVADADLTIGSHLVTERFGYTHHGIFAGAGKVVHYSGMSRLLRRGPVQEVTLDEFAQGHLVWIRQSPGAEFTGVEAVRRAYSRLGEDSYRLTSNNCEHFCMWCLYGEGRSDQIDIWKYLVVDVMDAGFNALRRASIATTSMLECVTRQILRLKFEGYPVS